MKHVKEILDIIHKTSTEELEEFLESVKGKPITNMLYDKEIDLVRKELKERKD